MKKIMTYNSFLTEGVRNLMKPKTTDEIISSLKDLTQEEKNEKLYYASEIGDLEVVKHLVENGANVRAKQSYGKEPILISSANGHLDVVKYLIEHGANVESKEIDGWTPLIYAASHNHLNVVKFLVKYGADVNKGNYDFNPMRAAIYSNNTEIVKVLLENGVNVNELCNIYGDHEVYLTPLMMAVVYDNLDIVKLLIDYNADEDIKNELGKTALDYAIEKDHKDIVKYLKYGE